MTRTILTVDDSRTMRDMLRMALVGAGFNVVEAVDGEHGLEVLSAHRPDVIITDINMPKLDGYGFLRQLRSEDIAQAPAIMVSTEEAEHDQTAAFRAGASYYIAKPVKPEQLLQHVRLLLGEL